MSELIPYREALVLILMGGGCAIWLGMVIVGGLKVLVSEGGSQRRDEGKNALKHAGIGALLIIPALAIVYLDSTLVGRQATLLMITVGGDVLAAGVIVGIFKMLTSQGDKGKVAVGKAFVKEALMFALAVSLGVAVYYLIW